MRIVTEDMIRRWLRQKVVSDGETIQLTEPSLLTPSAQSFLREHHIEVEKNASDKGPRITPPAFSQSTETLEQKKLVEQHTHTGKTAISDQRDIPAKRTALEKKASLKKRNAFDQRDASNSADQGLNQLDDLQHALSERMSRLSEWQIAAELTHLINLLYFSQIDYQALTPADWNELKLQQTWLEEFRHSLVEKTSIQQSPIAPQSIYCKQKEQQRQWLYACGEVKYQTETIINLMCQEIQTIAGTKTYQPNTLHTHTTIFMQWAQRFLQTIE